MPLQLQARGELLYKLADLMEKHADELAALETLVGCQLIIAEMLLTNKMLLLMQTASIRRTCRPVAAGLQFMHKQ